MYGTHFHIAGCLIRQNEKKELIGCGISFSDWTIEGLLAKWNNRPREQELEAENQMLQNALLLIHKSLQEYKNSSKYEHDYHSFRKLEKSINNAMEVLKDE